MRQQTMRSRVIQVWFAAVILLAVGGVAFGVAVTIGTGALLLAMCLVPPALALTMWPDGGASTIAEVLHEAERAPNDRVM